MANGSMDYDLLCRMAQGDESAFAALYSKFQGPIFRYALHMTANAHIAEDITQETFLQIIRDPHGYQPSRGAIGAYLFGIARHLTLRSMHPAEMQLPENPEALFAARLAPDDDTLTGILRAEEIQALRQAVQALPAPYREAVILCDMEEMSYADAAALLQCSAGTVASRLHRARALLATRLRRKECPT